MIRGIEARNITDDDRVRRAVERRLSPGISAMLLIREHDLGDFALRGYCRAPYLTAQISFRHLSVLS